MHANNTSGDDGTLRGTMAVMRKVSGATVMSAASLSEASLRSDNFFVSKDADPTLHLAADTKTTALN